MFQGAKWIAANNNIKSIQPAPLFRKKFFLSKKIDTAKMYACGLGQAEYYINGRKVTNDVMLTPVSKYDTRVYYHEFDIKELLNAGENVFGCVLGNGWYFVTYHRWDNYIPQWLHHPKLMVKIVITYTDGTFQEIVSDSSWKTAESAIVYNEDKRGEIYDARRYQEGWNTAQFDDSLWNSAFVCRGPGGKLCKIDFPPIRVTETRKAERISENVYDLGQNISGWARIRTRGKEGQKIIIRYAEVLHEDGTIAPEQLNTIVGSDTHCDQYILSGKGMEEWAPRFAYHGFRYMEVTGAPDEFEIVGEVIHTDLPVIGEFECGDEMINKIHQAVRWSTLTNMQSIPTDCTQREQNGWTGDSLLSADQILLNYDAVSYLKKWLVDIRDTQRPSGQICCIAPTSGWGYNWGSGPAWDSALIQIPYLIYYYTGDTTAIEEMWDSMVLYMKFMDSMEEDYLVNYGLGDWCRPKETEACPTIITDTAYYYADNCIMAKCATILGKDGQTYTEKADQIKKKFRSSFIDKDFYLYNHATAIACAIYQDLYTEQEKPIAAERLSKIYEENGFQINCGILGIKYLYTALSEYGYVETAYRLTVNPKEPSYAFWILNGMTTLCEDWNMKTSCNHHMYSDVDRWFYKYLAGIRIDEGGSGVCIEPCEIEEIKWVRARHKEISVYWDDKKISFSADVPIRFKQKERDVYLSSGEYVYDKCEDKIVKLR